MNDVKRNLDRQYFSLTQFGAQRYQLFKITNLLSIARGSQQFQRVGHKINLESLSFTIHITSDMHVREQVKNECIAQWNEYEMRYQDKSIALYQSPYTSNSTGFKYDFAAPVPGDASGVGTQVPVFGDVQTAYPTLENRVKALDNITFLGQSSGFFQDGGDHRDFYFGRVIRWKPDTLIRLMVIKCDFIFDRLMDTGDLFFETHATMRNPYNGVNSGTTIPVGSYFKEQFADTIEIVWEKYFHMEKEQNTFYRCQVPVDKREELQYMEGFTTPTFNNYDITPWTYTQPLRNNYYVIVMSSTQYGFNNFEQLFTEPTFGPVSCTWLIDLNIETRFRDVLSRENS